MFIRSCLIISFLISFSARSSSTIFWRDSHSASYDFTWSDVWLCLRDMWDRLFSKPCRHSTSNWSLESSCSWLDSRLSFFFSQSSNYKRKNIFISRPYTQTCACKESYSFVYIQQKAIDLTITWRYCCQFIKNDFRDWITHKDITNHRSENFHELNIYIFNRWNKLNYEILKILNNLNVSCANFLSHQLVLTFSSKIIYCQLITIFLQRKFF